MKVTFLGTGTAIPSPIRAPTSLLVRAGGEPLLFDTGPGVLRQLTAEGLYINDVEHVFYTHTHPDHVADLIPLIFASKNPDLLRTRPLRLYGGQGFADFFRGLQEAYHPWGKATVFDIHVEELGPEPLEGEGWSVRVSPVLHHPTSIAFRIESGGLSVTFSGDTDYCPEIVKLARHSDLLVLECAHPDERKVQGHLSPTLCGRIAAEAEARALALTHFYPACEGEDLIGPASKEYPGSITVAEDLMTIDV
jgi:ribonuclease BN (tRNA processing enzyme)